MSSRKKQPRRKRPGGASSSVQGRTMRLSEIFDIAMGGAMPPALGDETLAAVMVADGVALTRAESAGVILDLASLAYDTLALLEPEERDGLIGSWRQVVTDVAFGELVSSLED